MRVARSAFSLQRQMKSESWIKAFYCDELIRFKTGEVMRSYSREGPAMSMLPNVTVRRGGLQVVRVGFQ